MLLGLADALVATRVGGRGRYFHIWAARVCATQQGMLFVSLTLEQGIKITLSGSGSQGYILLYV